MDKMPNIKSGILGHKTLLRIYILASTTSVLSLRISNVDGTNNDTITAVGLTSMGQLKLI